MLRGSYSAHELQWNSCKVYLSRR